MAVNELTLSGNLTGDPTRRVTAGGRLLTTFRVASTGRRVNKATDTWEDGKTLYLNVSCWGSLADHVARSVRKGDEVVCIGRLEQHDWQDEDGNPRTKLEMKADVVGTGLTFAVARPSKQPVDPQRSRVSAHVEAGADLSTGEPLVDPGDVPAWDQSSPEQAPPPDEDDEDVAPAEELVGAAG